ncbi:hypothetical protein FNV68_34670 [Streptomyces sp. S1D4-23]|nr:hypothetical protein FNV61_33500 [Streptomyces sp. RLB3-6]QDO10665.1 hypothetical protein FNV68_34670 [Streptomyces sp. S1D4-23]
MGETTSLTIPGQKGEDIRHQNYVNAGQRVGATGDAGGGGRCKGGERGRQGGDSGGVSRRGSRAAPPCRRGRWYGA